MTFISSYEWKKGHNLALYDIMNDVVNDEGHNVVHKAFPTAWAKLRKCYLTYQETISWIWGKEQWDIITTEKISPPMSILISDDRKCHTHCINGYSIHRRPCGIAISRHDYWQFKDAIRMRIPRTMCSWIGYIFIFSYVIKPPTFPFVTQRSILVFSPIWLTHF